MSTLIPDPNAPIATPAAPTVQHIDATGRAVKPGDFVVYAVSQGSSSAELKFGRVLALRTRMQGYPASEWPWCSCLTVTSTHPWSFKPQPYALQNKGRPVAINLGAMMVVPSSRVPAEARTLLKCTTYIARAALRGAK